MIQWHTLEARPRHHSGCDVARPVAKAMLVSAVVVLEEALVLW